MRIFNNGIKSCYITNLSNNNLNTNPNIIGNIVAVDSDSLHNGGVFKMIYDDNLDQLISWGFEETKLIISRTYFGGINNITRILFTSSFPTIN